MAVAARPTAREIGAVFAEAVRCQRYVEGLWVTERPDGAHLWLIVRLISDDEERRLYGMLCAVEARYPDADFQLHIMSPDTHGERAREALPADADEIHIAAA